jgi:WD40 repeat protein/transcriptional regulator with XRE-family HTH domain
VTEQPGLDFAGLLRQLRERALLTQEELAETAGLSPRAVSDLERGIHRTARKDTAVLLAGALGLAGPARELFVAAALGRAPAADVLAASGGLPGAGGGTGGQAGTGRRPGSPYRGLQAFGEQDAGWFFGREAATAQVLQRMTRLVAGAGVLVVSGVSGAGKSSLLAAGVLPQIRRTGLAGAAQAASWPCLVFTPTRAPLDELALRIAPLAGADAAAVRRGLDADPAGFALTARQAALAQPPEPARDLDGPEELDQQPPQQRSRRLVLVVDQFEELFTQCADEGQRRAFITALHAAASTSHGPGHIPAALVVLAVRADFEAHCADYPQLAAAIQDRYLVTAMTERQLRMAITEPAKKAGSEVDGGLATVLLGEVRNGQPGIFAAGVLPLLSHALDQAWRSGTGTAVTLADYERTGGIEGAVAASAQRAYDALTPAQKATARQVFLRLTATSSEGIDSADRATRADLTAGKTAAEAADVNQVLEAFAAERMLTLAAGTVELSHEILLTAWPLLRDTWLADTHADRIVRTRLHHTATEWDHHARDPSYLYTGTLLQAATGTAARISADPARHPSLGQTETDFLHASDRAHRRIAHRRNVVIAGLLALIVTAVTAAGIAVYNAASAARQHAIALSRQLAFDSLSVDLTNPVTARRLAVASWQVYPTAQAGSAMTTLLTEQQQNGILPADPLGVNGIAFSPDGGLLASAGGDGVVRLWHPATGQAVGTPLVASTRGGVNAVAFSPQGGLLATAGRDGVVRVWHPATGQLIHVLHISASTRGGVHAVAFSPQGGLLATGDVTGVVRLWHPATGQLVRTLSAASAQVGSFGVAFSPQGGLLATADSDGTVRLWHPATGQLVRTLSAASAQVGLFGVAFSPQGGLLATADSDGTVRLWHPATGQLVRVLPTAQGGVFGVAFSPQGGLVATGGADGTVRVWHPATGQLVRVLPTAQGGVFGVAFSPQGGLLASANSDGTVRVWNPATGRPADGPIHATSPLVPLTAMAFSPDNKLLATAGQNGMVRVWNPATGQPAGTPIPATSAQVSAMAFSTNSKLLATADVTGLVRVWHPVNGRPVGPSLHAPRPQSGGPAMAFSPDGRLLATAAGNGAVWVWNPFTGQPAGRPLRATSAQAGTSAVAVSPNGKLLATVGHGGTVWVWHPATGQLVHVLATAPGGVLGVAFSYNSNLLATANSDGSISLWNPVTGQPLGTPPYFTNVQGLAFSPNSNLLATANSDGSISLWNPVTGQPLGTPLPADTGPNGIVAAVAFSRDGKLLATAYGDGTVRLWEVPLFTHPYAALCADVGPPTPQNWAKYAPGEPRPKACA